MRNSSNALRSHVDDIRLARGAVYRLSPIDGREDGGTTGSGSRGAAATREELPFKVELWNEAKTAVEIVLAVTANASIGYAAYYAATREYPQRYVTLRDKAGIISRWNGPSH